jgi:hypothetical protein
MLDQEGPRITPSHKGIPGNKKADQAAKTTLDEDISTTERSKPDFLHQKNSKSGPVSNKYPN